MIPYFSGTGNTRLAADRLARLTGDQAVPIDFDAASMPLQGRRDRIVWCFPTYSWGPPPVVADFISRVRLEAGGIPHFMLTTCGDDMAYTDCRWKRLIAARGWQAAGAFAVAMPNTYVLMKGFDVDSPETAAAKLAAMPAAMERIADAIGSGDPDILIRGSWPWVKSYVIYPWLSLIHI